MVKALPGSIPGLVTGGIFSEASDKSMFSGSTQSLKIMGVKAAGA